MVLNIKNLEFGFTPQKKILSNINLKANQGEFITIVGPSGCGKSTFLRLITGIIQRDKYNLLEGEINFDGINTAEYCGKGKIGFMFQEPTLLPYMTVRENIELPLKLKNQNNPEEVTNLLSMVGLIEYSHFLPKQLSGGMKRRADLVKTFITQPEILCLDEPFSSLDIKWRFSLYKELEVLRKNYSPLIIMVSHDLQEALLADRVLVFGKRGKILKELTLDKHSSDVFNPDVFKEFQNEYSEIQDLILYSDN